MALPFSDREQLLGAQPHHIEPRPIAVTVPHLRLSKTYWVICPKATSTLPKIVTFRNWLLAEAAADTRRLLKLHKA